VVFWKSESLRRSSRKVRKVTEMKEVDLPAEQEKRSSKEKQKKN